MSTINMTQPGGSHKSPAELEAEAFECEAKAATLRAEATRLRDAEQRVQQRAPSVVIAEPRLLSASDLARRLGVSVAHVRRLDPPGVIVGDKSTKRYDLAAVRAWLQEREPTPTTPAKKIATHDNDVDVIDSLAKVGITKVNTANDLGAESVSSRGTPNTTKKEN
jgi:hypothetical protein